MTSHQPKYFRDPCLIFHAKFFITQDYFIFFSKFSPRDFHKLEESLKNYHNVEIMKNHKMNNEIKNHSCK